MKARAGIAFSGSIQGASIVVPAAYRTGYTVASYYRAQPYHCYTSFFCFVGQNVQEPSDIRCAFGKPPYQKPTREPPAFAVRVK